VLATDEYVSLGLALSLRQQVHQRRLAGAVLAGDGVDFPPSDAQSDIDDGVDTGEAFGDVAELDRGRIWVDARL
jgi:hypothetical protein